MNLGLSTRDQVLRASLEESSSGAIFSEDRIYRYVLWRRWSDLSNLTLFVALNPSTADEARDDPTIRRCKGFAHSWGASGFLIVNLYAFRATLPKDLFAASDPIGLENDEWIVAASGISKKAIVCWGNHGMRGSRAKTVLAALGNALCLRMTKRGEPSHPLYLPAGLVPVPVDKVQGESEGAGWSFAR